MHLLAVCRARCERVASQQYLLEHSSLNMINILIFKACTFSLHLRRKNQHSVVADIIKNFINKAETNGYFKKLPAI